MKIRKIYGRRQMVRQGHRQHGPQKGWSQWIRQRAKHLKVGRIIETCGCDVARITAVDPEGDDLEYESLTVGGRGHCSIYNCGPLRLTPLGIEKRLNLFKEGGKKALSRRFYIEDCKMTPEEADAAIAEWS